MEAIPSLVRRTLAVGAAALAIGLAASGARAEPLRQGGKLLLTNGISTIEGASGGGLATWSVIAGNETRDGIGGSIHATVIELEDYGWRSFGGAIGLFDRIELSYARQTLDTNAMGGRLGIGDDYHLDQHVFGAKVRLFGDLVYGDPLVPQVAIGVQHRRNDDEAIVAAVGGRSPNGTDYYISATKLFLSHSLLVNVTARLTNANQAGLLGFGGDRRDSRTLQFEGSLGYQLSRRLVIGAEYRTKPDNLGFAEEEDWMDIFVVYAINRHLTATAAYVDLGSVATSEPQRGVLLSLQAAF